MVTCLALAGAAAPARAGRNVDCVLVEADVIEPDGIIDDWEGISAVAYGTGDGERRVRCAQSSTHLFLLVDVTDNQIVRTGRPARGNQDELTIGLGVGTTWNRLVVAPGTRGFPPFLEWNRRPPRRGVQLVDSLQENGWAVEAAIPLTELVAWGPGTPALRLRTRYRDVDGGPASVDESRAALFFAGAIDVYRGFMQQTGMRPADVRVDRLLELDGEPGVERLIIGGKVLGVLGLTYGYVSLPVQNDADVLDVQVVDLTGKGRSSVITRFRQHGTEGGSRDLVAVWMVQNDGRLERVLAFEVRKALAERSIDNEWRLVPKVVKSGRKSKTVPGFDLVHEAGRAVGFDETTFQETPAADVRSILLPWGEQTSRVYHFEGDGAFGGEPLEAAKEPSRGARARKRKR